jgi:hypothetical protein
MEVIHLSDVAFVGRDFQVKEVLWHIREHIQVISLSNAILVEKNSHGKEIL